MNNVILVGYMGCGKSTVGIRLSYRLKMPFLDTDKEIEKKHSCVISEVFATLGEETFRNWETEYLKKLGEKNAAYVISTGGGMVLREENRAAVEKAGYGGLSACKTRKHRRTSEGRHYQTSAADGKPSTENPGDAGEKGTGL